MYVMFGLMLMFRLKLLLSARFVGVADAADAGPSAGPWLKGIGDDAADAGPKHRGDKKFGG